MPFPLFSRDEMKHIHPLAEPEIPGVQIILV